MTIPRIEDLLNSPEQQNQIPDIHSLLGVEKPKYGVMNQNIAGRVMNSEWGQAMLNRTRGMSKVLKTALTLDSFRDKEDKKVEDIWNQGISNKVEAFKQVNKNFSKEYSASEVLDGIGTFIGGANESLKKERNWEDLPSVAADLVALPVHMVYSIIADAAQLASPIDVSEKEIKPASIEKQTNAIQMTVANAVAIAIAPVISESIGAAFKASTMLTAESTGLQAAQIASKTPKLGAMGRAIIADVTAGAGAGVAQGGVASAGSPDMIAQALTGLMFGSLGILTGWYRGFKGGGFDTVDRNIVSARDIANLRQVNNVADASIETLGKRAAQLLGWNSIDDVANIVQDKTISVDIKGAKISGGAATSGKSSPSFVDEFFEKNFDENKPFEPQIAKFLVETGIPEKEMMLTRNMMANTILQKYGDSHALTTLEGNKLTSSSFDAVDVANRHGFFLDNEHGQIVIRNLEDGIEMTRASTTKQAVDWMRETGEPNGFPLDPNANLPTSIIGKNGNGIIPPAMSHLQDGWTPEKGWSAQDRMAQLDVELAALSSTDARVVSVDRLTSNTPQPTNIKQKVIEKIEPIRRQTEQDIKAALSSTRMQAISNLARTSTPERLELIGKWQEAQNIDEIFEVGGFQVGNTLSKAPVMEAAQHNLTNNVDWTQVLRYRRVLKGAELRYKLLAIENGLEKYKLNTLADVFSKEDILAEVKQTEADYGKHPDFQALMVRINDAFKPDENFLKAAAMAENMANGVVDATAHLAAVGRVTQALKFPEEMNLTRAEFAAKYKFTPVEQKLAESLEEAYGHYGKKYGISDSRMFRRYLNHYRQYGDIMDTFIEDEFSRGINDTGVRKFASDMVRTGEIANYGTNPIEAITSYIRAGEKSTTLYPKLDELFNRKPDGRPSPVSEELNKIGSEDLRAFAKETIMNYHNGVSGHPSSNSKLATANEAYLQRNLGKTNAEIIAKMKEPNVVDTIMAVNTTGLIGGRVSMALRDRYDVYQKFYTVHGAKRFADLVTQKVPKGAIADLVRSGEITDPSPVDFYNIGAKTGTTSNAARQLADFGYYLSAQHHFYMQHQSAVYLETMSHVGRIADDLINNRVTKKQAYKDVFINSFDVSTQREFDAILSGNNANSQQAARLLAREEVRRMVGTFGRGNQPAIANSTVGKMFGQLGSWSMANRSVMQQIGTRGTAKELAGVYSRYAASMALTKAVGAATGLNLGRWALMPTSVMFTGGPIVELIKNFGSFTQASDDPNVMKYAARQLYRSSTQFIPFGYAMRDVETAMQLSTEGDGYGYGRIGAQAIGIPVAKNNQTLLDYINGQYPMPPQNPTGVIDMLKEGF